MAIEVLRGGKIKTPSAGPQQQSPGLLSSLGTGLAQAGTGILGGAAQALHVPSLIHKGLNYISGNKQPVGQDVPTTQGIRESLGVPEPEGFVPEALDRIAHDLPLIAATGGLSSLPTLTKSLVQSGSAALGGQTAKEAGLGPWGELLGSLGGQWGTTKGLNALKRIHAGWGGEKLAKEAGKGVRPFLENAQKEAYKKSEELYKGVKVPSGKLRASLDVIDTNLKRGGTTAAKTTVLKSLEEFEHKMAGGKVSMQDAIDFKKEWSGLGFTRGKEESRWYKQMGKTMDDFIKQEGKINPQAFKAYNQGNALHASLKSGEKIREAVDALKEGKFTSSNFFRGLMGIGKKVIPAEQAKFFATRPEARKYYFQSFQAAAKDNPVLMINSLKKLSNIAGLYEKEKETKPKLEVLRGGLKHNK